MPEAEFKRSFKRSVRAQSGVVFSLAAMAQAGLPDMYVLMPEHKPILVEAKLLNANMGPRFHRKIPLSAYQSKLLKTCWDIQPGSVWILVGFVMRSEFYACLVPGNCDNIDYTILENGVYHCLERKNQLMDVRSMLEILGLNVENGKYAKHGKSSKVRHTLWDDAVAV